MNYVITVATLSILWPILSAFMSLSSFSHIKVNVIGIIIRIQVDVNLLKYKMKPNALFKNRYVTFNDKKMGSPLPDQLKRDTDSLIFDGKVVLVEQWGRDGEFSLSFYNKAIIRQPIKYWEVVGGIRLV